MQPSPYSTYLQKQYSEGGVVHILYLSDQQCSRSTVFYKLIGQNMSQTHSQGLSTSHPLEYSGVGVRKGKAEERACEQDCICHCSTMQGRQVQTVSLV